MPTVATGPEMRLCVLSAIARGEAHELADVEAGLAHVDGETHFVLAFNAGGKLHVFTTSPLGGVLIAQQLTELVTSNGGVIALLREAMGPGPHGQAVAK